MIDENKIKPFIFFIFLNSTTSRIIKISNKKRFRHIEAYEIFTETTRKNILFNSYTNNNDNNNNNY